MVVSLGTYGSNGGGAFGYIWIQWWWCLWVIVYLMVAIPLGTHGPNGSGVFGYTWIVVPLDTHGFHDRGAIGYTWIP